MILSFCNLEGAVKEKGKEGEKEKKSKFEYHFIKNPSF